MRENQTEMICALCKRHLPETFLFPLDLVKEDSLKLIYADHPVLEEHGYICRDDLTPYYIAWSQQYSKDPSIPIDTAVMRSEQSLNLIAKTTVDQLEDNETIGEKLADKLTTFGGSWRFLISFGVFLALWITWNIFCLHSLTFDPYPFILLNLILSCLAAIQAPIIMMSQNRQESRDRIRAQNDYEIDLKAELEIRDLHDKVDRLFQELFRKIKNQTGPVFPSDKKNVEKKPSLDSPKNKRGRRKA